MMKTVPLLFSSLLFVRESVRGNQITKMPCYIVYDCRKVVLKSRQEELSCFLTCLGEDTHRALGLVGIELEHV